MHSLSMITNPPKAHIHHSEEGMSSLTKTKTKHSEEELTPFFLPPNFHRKVDNKKGNIFLTFFFFFFIKHYRTKISRTNHCSAPTYFVFFSPFLFILRLNPFCMTTSSRVHIFLSPSLFPSIIIRSPQFLHTYYHYYYYLRARPARTMPDFA